MSAPRNKVGYNGVQLTEKEYLEATKHGCAVCTEQAENLEDHEIMWMDSGSFICTDCCDDELNHVGIQRFH